MGVTHELVLKEDKILEKMSAELVCYLPEYTNCLLPNSQLSVSDILMVKSFHIVQQTWEVPIDHISDQAEAQSQAQLFETLHPGLKFTGSWRSIVHGKVSAIEVTSAGPVIVSLGPTSGRSDADSKIAAFLRKHPYLKHTGNCSETGWRQNFQIVVEASLPTEWHMQGGTDGLCLPVTTNFRIKNLTSDRVIRISARGSEAGDWGERRPRLQFADCQIDPRGSLEKQLDVNYWSRSAKLTAWLTFQSGQCLQFRVNQQVAIDNSGKNLWKFSSGQGLLVYPLVDPSFRRLEVVVCQS